MMRTALIFLLAATVAVHPARGTRPFVAVEHTEEVA